MNKPALIQKIKSIEGLTNEERVALIELVNTKKKYGLVWEDKPEDVEEQLRANLPVFREVTKKRILAKDIPQTPKAKPTPVQTDIFTDSEAPLTTNNSPLTNPNHILIEGDNLHALTALTFTHEGRIDVIYIDPPYNTGNKDFKYNDSFVDKEDTYRHSKWLSFMEKRLRIAKRLLSEKGVVFISIDDNEQAQLKLLCDDIFGEANFIEIFSWVRTETPARLSKKSLKVIEYVLCYQMSINSPDFKGFKSESTSSNTLLNKPNTYKTLVFPENIVDTGLNNGIYIKGKYGTSAYNIVLEEDTEVNEGYFIKPIVLSANFRWSQEKLDTEINVGTKISIRTLTFSPSYEKSDYEAGAPKNLINRDVNVFTNEFAKRELEEINVKFFDYPKPISLIKYLVSFTHSKSQFILDFFAGSGTTLHATMQLNAEDGGNRQCILVTNNENNICEEVTYERNKRVIQGYTNSKGNWVDGLTNNNLRYYKSEFVPSVKNEQNKRLLTHASTDLLCIKEDCYEDITAAQGFHARQCRIFRNDAGKMMVVVYHSRNQLAVIEQLITFIKTLENLSDKVKLYAFSPEKETLLEDFYEVADIIDAVPLPEAIYNAYRATFRSIKLGTRSASKTKKDPTAGEPNTSEADDTIPAIFDQTQEEA